MDDDTPAPLPRYVFASSAYPGAARNAEGVSGEVYDKTAGVPRRAHQRPR